MSTTLPVTPSAPKYTKKDFESDQDVRWCPGCGDYAILAQVQKVMPEIGVPREKMVFISGIGCSSRFPYYMNTYGFHTIHGRAPSFVTGLRMANPDLHVWMVTGDGDGLSIGGNHLLHILRRNVDVRILLFNNRIYGLTKGQYSPTSEAGKVTKSSPFGSVEHAITPVLFALSAEATFVARTVDRNLAHMEGVLKRAAKHKGAAFVEIYQNCNIFNDGAFSYLTDRETKVETELQVKHGQPLVFGPVDNRRAIKLEGLKPVVVKYDEKNTAGLWIYDENDPAHALALSKVNHPEFPVPIGVFLDVARPVYENALIEQELSLIQQKGSGDVKKLIEGDETWEVK
ncbi:MAG TPA: 2-oxoacid:ferredoxin oxidoreductase subunit beta [Planctomycetota bacterium]|nr:2-oxoacid:ferredoxin oxidoreductase subunit beta [Planctomycetota bacterium]